MWRSIGTTLILNLLLKSKQLDNTYLKGLRKNPQLTLAIALELANRDLKEMTNCTMDNSRSFRDDTSEFDGHELTNHGVYKYLDHQWTDEYRKPCYFGTT